MKSYDVCPICGGIIGYHINSYGRIVEQCSRCKHIIPDDPVITTNKTTITNNNYVANTNALPPNYSKDYIKVDDCKPYEIDQSKSNSIEIKCKTITLKQGEVEITFDLNRQLKDYDSIIINGVKFKKVEKE